MRPPPGPDSLGLLVERWREDDRKARRAVASSVFFNLAILVFFKYWDFIASNLNVPPAIEKEAHHQQDEIAQLQWRELVDGQHGHEIEKQKRQTGKDHPDLNKYYEDFMASLGADNQPAMGDVEGEQLAAVYPGLENYAAKQSVLKIILYANSALNASTAWS